MTIKQLCLSAAFSWVVIAFMACQKDVSILQPPSQNRDTAVITNEKPLVCHAGEDVTLQLPLDSVVLGGSYVSNRTITRVEWKMIEGTGGQIRYPSVINPMVRALQAGVYHFQLTVTDDINRVAIDTVKVTVLEGVSVTVSPGTVLYRRLTWIFPWYSTVEAPNIDAYVPKGASIKVYIQRGSNTNWIEVPLASHNPNNHVYEYFIETRHDGGGMYHYGSLYVFFYGTDVSDNPNLKVTF